MIFWDYSTHAKYSITKRGFREFNFFLGSNDLVGLCHNIYHFFFVRLPSNDLLTRLVPNSGKNMRERYVKGAFDSLRPDLRLPPHGGVSCRDGDSLGHVVAHVVHQHHADEHHGAVSQLRTGRFHVTAVLQQKYNHRPKREQYTRRS